MNISTSDHKPVYASFLLSLESSDKSHANKTERTDSIDDKQSEVVNNTVQDNEQITAAQPKSIINGICLDKSSYVTSISEIPAFSSDSQVCAIM
jgi:hypothetical protein